MREASRAVGRRLARRAVGLLLLCLSAMLPVLAAPPLHLQLNLSNHAPNDHSLDFTLLQPALLLLSSVLMLLLGLLSLCSSRISLPAPEPRPSPPSDKCDASPLMHVDAPWPALLLGYAVLLAFCCFEQQQMPRLVAFGAWSCLLLALDSQLSECAPLDHSSTHNSTETRGDPLSEPLLARSLSESLKEDAEVEARSTREVNTEVCSLLSALSASDTTEQRNAALMLRATSRSAEFQSAFLDSGGLEVILSLSVSSDPETEAHARTSLYNISLEDSLKSRLTGALPLLAASLDEASSAAAELACSTLYSLSTSVDLYSSMAECGAVPALVRTLESGTEATRLHACKALFNLSRPSSSTPASHCSMASHLVQAGALRALLAALSASKSPRPLPEKACLVLRNLVKCEAGMQGLVSEADSIPLLVGVLDSGTALAQESAAAVLLALAQRSPELARLVWEEAPMMALDVLSRRGTTHARKKAAALLQLLCFTGR